MRQRVLLGIDIVPMLSSHPSLRQNWEFRFLLAHHQWQNCCRGNSTKGVILFLLKCTFVVPSVKNTASVFQEISFMGIHYFPLFSCKQYDISTDLIPKVQKLRANTTAFKFYCGFTMISIHCQWVILAMIKGWRSGSIIKPCAWVHFATGGRNLECSIR